MLSSSAAAIPGASATVFMQPRTVLWGARVRYDYDEFDNLLSAEYKQGNDVERIYRIPDRIGNLFETREKDDRKYGAGSRLTEDRDYFLSL